MTRGCLAAARGPAVVEGGLPTLLHSRPRVPLAEDSGEKQEKSAGGVSGAGARCAAAPRRRPTPGALALEDILEETDSLPLVVKNTFIEGVSPLSPSLAAFYKGRAMHTCPSHLSGSLAAFARSAPACASPDGAEAPRAVWEIDTPTHEDAYEYPRCRGDAVPTEASMLDFYGGVATVPAALPAFPPVWGDLLEAPSAAAGRRTILNLASELVANERPSRPSAAGYFIAPQADATGAGDGFRPSALPPPPPCAPAPGSAQLPSVGSSDHAVGLCKPCAFLHTKGCQNGFTCKFCHLCGPDEKRRRKKDKLEFRRVFRQAVARPVVTTVAR